MPPSTSGQGGVKVLYPRGKVSQRQEKQLAVGIILKPIVLMGSDDYQRW